MPKEKGKIIACLDLGTTKLTCVISNISEKKITILGYSYKKSQGIVSSAISDMKLAQELILKVVSDAEKMAGFNIDKLIISLSGSQVLSQKKEISNKISGSMVKKHDVINLAHKIANEYRKKNREIIHLIPLQYKIDDSNYVQNPRYMSGKKITSKFHVVSVATSVTKNIENCLKSCRLSVNNYILESYGAYLSATNERDSNLGSLTIDFGGVSTSFCVIYEGKLVYCGHVKVGGMHITKDISKILNVDFDVAQQIKILNNSLIINPLEERELIKMKIDSFGDNFGLVKITKKELKEIITCRIEEIVELVKKDLSDNGYGPHIFNNIMLSGGVCGIIGIEKIVNEIFNKQSRVIYPTKIHDLPNQLNDPSFASVIGMLVYLQDIYKKEKNSEGFNSKGGLIKRFIDYLMSL